MQVIDLNEADFPPGTRPFFYNHVIAPTYAILPPDYYYLGQSLVHFCITYVYAAFPLIFFGHASYNTLNLKIQ